ncbi:hypothetical protein KGF54_004698 [Candida jiufengensis]|uniref:uncharacterized protein n=1 Tax=Candida jiufengensis TaxID=497108 RepID=UPI00222409F6|nr:uncharacterized protein KGF54_004698 [Candida jiufengensis]KAI5951624.1 hypothetical protein KGF54_004698 [Candida jiufengensis]
MSAITSTITPFRALLIGGGCYSIFTVMMFKNYFKNSSMRKIYTTADSNYEKVHPMSYPQYEGNVQPAK